MAEKARWGGGVRANGGQNTLGGTKRKKHKFARSAKSIEFREWSLGEVLEPLL